MNIGLIHILRCTDVPRYCKDGRTYTHKIVFINKLTNVNIWSEWFPVFLYDTKEKYNIVFLFPLFPNNYTNAAIGD